MEVGVHLIYLSQDRGTLRAVVSMAMDFQIPQTAENIFHFVDRASFYDSW
jgi:hypothetical protein